MPGVARRLARALPDYAFNAWLGLVTPRLRRGEAAEVVQGVVLGERGVLLAVRSNLRGWELPGGHGAPGESAEQALAREILEETGVAVEVGPLVGEYHRSGFRPHRARVYRCRPVSGEPRASVETPQVRWWPVHALPDTLFPWFRGPLEDALEGRPEPVVRRERQGLAAIWAGLRIDLRMRLSEDRAGGGGEGS